jgi:hypothetical protein
LKDKQGFSPLEKALPFVGESDFKIWRSGKEYRRDNIRATRIFKNRREIM